MPKTPKLTILQPAKMEDAVSAWKLSRDRTADYDVNMIAGIDAPVMEMPSALIYFDDFTIIEREIICSLRNHVVWARTSRVDDPRLFTTPEEFEVGDHEISRKHMNMMYANGEPQDTWRGFLPLVAHTSWTQRISLRDLARLAMYFGYLINKAQWRPLAIRFARVEYQIVDLIVRMCGSKVAHEIMAHCKLAKFLHESRMPTATSLSRQQFFTTVAAPIPVSLRAQIVRHRELQFVDDFWSMINCEELPYLRLNNKVNMQMSARNDIWQAVLSKRACWIAQADLWQPIIEAFGWHPPLPCSENNKCPYEVDARARLIPGKDPNPPCPVFCNLYKVPKDQWSDAMRKEATKRGSFWVQQVNQ